MSFPAKKLGNPNWVPGVCQNPTGKPKLPEHLRLIKAFTAPEIARYIAKYGRSTMEELILVESDKESPMIERIFSRMFRQAFDSDSNTALATLKFLLDRSIGKVPDIILTDQSADDPERESLKRLSLDELLQVVRRMIPETPIPKYDPEES